eukprot:TRINITY_DN33420_c0_g1_i1.p1 TRINITY_DN33420_c0_g1~~TRINITY_DN33420_c0_g1_i1.p1  ORF type:complete len:288 (+),score=89.22 TRINITY_DN33420_c0_g1_i1:55-864(+)
MAAAADGDAAAGAFFGPAVQSITHARGHADEVIKGASLGVARDDTSPAPADAPQPHKCDFLLCETAWYKLKKDGRSPDAVLWRDSFDNIHSVEPSLQNANLFNVYFFVSQGDDFNICQRSLVCDSEAERDDWVVLFRALLTNFFQRLFERDLIPAPGVYQWHLSVKHSASGGAAPTLLILVISTVDVQLVHVPSPSTPSRVFLKVKADQISKVQRYADAPEKLCLHISGTSGAEQHVLQTRNGLESTTVVAEVMRFVKMSGGSTPVEVV